MKKQYQYGYSVFFNINICRNNMDDVRELTEIAHDHGIATDYHINESPMMDQPDFKHMEDNLTFITPEDFGKVDELVDWLIEKKKSGYKMVNSASRLDEMRHFMRGKVQEWNCRAGYNSLIVRTDGTLAPCFPMYNATYDWGAIENHKFETTQLTRDEEGVPAALLLHSQPHPGVLLQRCSRHQMDVTAGAQSVPGNH